LRVLEPELEMNKLIFANLLHRPLRSLISVLAVAVEVVMMLTIIAIMVGQLTGQKRLNNGIGADLIVRPGNAVFFNGVAGSCGSAPRYGGFAGDYQPLNERRGRGAVGDRLPELQPVEPLCLSIRRADPGA
jgi:hypothetical protein